MTYSSRSVRRAAALAGAGACAVGLVAATGAVAGASPAVPMKSVTSAGPFVLDWKKTALADPGATVGLGSPVVATLDDKGPAVIVGDRQGYIFAFHTSDGSSVKGWPYNAGAAIDSTPAVVGSGSKAVVYVGVGNSANPSKGGYLKLSAKGRKIWKFTPKALPGGGTAGVQGSLSIGTMQGTQVVAGGPMGQEQYILNARTGKPMPGWPWYQADTNFTTYALADLYGTGSDVAIEGGDSTHGISYGKWYANGGHLRILKPTGNHGTKLAGGALNPSGGTVCSYDMNQVVQSSPAVGRILKGKKNGIAFGTGNFYHGVSDTNKLTVVNDHCKKVWQKKLDGLTTSSPLLADTSGNGALNVVETTQVNSRKGAVYAFRGTDGKQLWHSTLPEGTVYGSPVTINLTGKHQDILVPSTAGLYVVDGTHGHILYHLHDGMAMQNAPVVSVEKGGKAVGVTIAGYRLYGGKLRTSIEHFTVRGVTPASVTAAGSWPMFHHDAQLRGNTGTVKVSSATTTSICRISIARCKRK